MQSPLHFVTAQGAGTSSFQVVLGNVDPITRPSLTQEFLLKNTAGSSVRVTRLQGSCGCTSLLLNGLPVEQAVSVAPGELVRLQAVHDFFLIKPGQMTKYVWVYIEGEKRPAATVEVKLNLKPCVRFYPETMVFGKVPAGERRSQRVRVEIDRRLIPAVGESGLARLASSDPDITVTEAGTRPKPLSGDVVIREFTVTLSPRASLGVHFASLSYPPATGGRPTVDPRGLILAQVSLGVQAVVEGRIVVTPAIGLFGEVEFGKEHVQSLALTGKDDKALKGISVWAGSPWLAARIAHTLGDPRKATLEMRVRAIAPTGSHQVQVLLRTADGQRLIVPVTVVVAAPHAGR